MLKMKIKEMIKSNCISNLPEEIVHEMLIALKADQLFQPSDLDYKQFKK